MEDINGSGKIAVVREKEKKIIF